MPDPVDSQLIGYEPGTLVAGRYEILGCLGVGAMGLVFRVADRELKGEQVALKLLHPHLTVTESALERFRNEVLLARQLIDKRVVRVYEFGATGTQFYITMELVEGRSLAELLEVENGLSFSESLDILYQVSLGLAHAHSMGVIHRDIKPQNIMVSREGVVKLSDFGTARLIGDESNLTRTGDSVGTAYYMSPEQIRGQEVDGRCDIYSFGITAFELAAGRRPFEDQVYLDLVLKHLEEPLPSLCEVNSEIPEWFEKFVKRCCAKQPEERHQSMDEVVEVLSNKLHASMECSEAAAALLWQKSDEQDKKTAQARKKERWRHIRKHVLRLLPGTILILAFVLPRSSNSIFLRVAEPVIKAERYLPEYLLYPLRKLLGISDISQTKDPIFWVKRATVREKERYLAIVRIRAGMDLSIRDLEQRTALMLAASQGDGRLVAELLEFPIEVNAQDASRATALHYAAKIANDTVILELLMNAGADPTLRDSEGYTPLHWAVSELHLLPLNALLRDSQRLVHEVDGMGRTAMHVVVLTLAERARQRSANKAVSGSFAVDLNLATSAARFLLAAGADPHLQDNSGNSALDYARESKLPAIEQLLEAAKPSQNKTS